MVILIFADPLLNFRRKAKQAKHVRDGHAAFADAAGNLFLRKAKLDDQLLVGLGFFNGIQVFALQILD